MKIKKFRIAVTMVILSTAVLAETTKCTDVEMVHSISLSEVIR